VGKGQGAMKRVLLTGAAGFLGSHLSKKLLEQGYDVIGLDDLSTGSLDNLLPVLPNPHFKFVEWDVRKPFKADVDLILNFACPASPQHYQADPVKTIETNFLGAINLLHLARETGSVFLQASTSEVYGDPAVSPQPESYWGNVNPIGIRSCYDEGKRAAETLCYDYRRQYDVDTRVIRIFNTYGPNMAVGDGRVVSNFIVQALRAEPITLYGDGMQTRSFCFVDDLVTGICSVMDLNSPPETPINLGNPQENTMVALAQIILDITGSSSELEFMPLPEDDPKQRKPDISFASELLNWRPATSLVDGISTTVEHFRRLLG
jgi:UDP-glucuronate decarboxylase